MPDPPNGHTVQCWPDKLTTLQNYSQHKHETLQGTDGIYSDRLYNRCAVVRNNNWCDGELHGIEQRNSWCSSHELVTMVWWRQRRESYSPRSEITASWLGSESGLGELKKKESSFKIKQIIIPQDKLSFLSLTPPLLLGLIFPRKNSLSSSLHYSNLGVTKVNTWKRGNGLEIRATL